MDFQSAARFGERRVMVTDYDETAVEVNAKVVDEDTGEVICECESGGGGESDFSIANVTALGGDPNAYIKFPTISDMQVGEIPDASTAYILRPGVDDVPYQVILYKGHCEEEICYNTKQSIIL